MRKVLILFSHELTNEQRNELFRKGIKEIIDLPEDLKKKWSSVPTELESLKEYSKEFIKWIDRNSDEGDYVLVQGDFGLTNLIVDYCMRKGLIPIYSTTERIHREIKLSDGSVRMEKIFKHKIFRRYEKWEE